MSTYSGTVYCLDSGDLTRRARKVVEGPDDSATRMEAANGFVTSGGCA